MNWACEICRRPINDSNKYCEETLKNRINGTAILKNSSAIFQKGKYPALLLKGIYPREKKMYVWRSEHKY